MCIMAEMGTSRRMMMMDWDGLDIEDDEFFESRDRISSVVSIRIASPDDDDEDYDDSRISFASATSAPPEEFRSFAVSATPEDYNIWMAEPTSIQDRRQRLLQGMGLSTEKELLHITSLEPTRSSPPPHDPKPPEPKLSPSPLHATLSLPLISPLSLISRSKSEANVVAAFVDAKCRQESFLDVISKQRLKRLYSMPSSQKCHFRATSIAPFRAKSIIRSKDGCNGLSNGGGGVLIKNLDTGKVFLINKDGTTSCLSDLQTGKQLTMEEFEKTVGHSPIVKELMRRENVARGSEDGSGDGDKKGLSVSASARSKSFRAANKKKGVNWLKNIKGVANSINGFMADKEREREAAQQSSNTNSSKWTKIHQHGKSYKELTGLYMCQEIQAHEGSIWTIKFSSDARYLATAGEDRVIHIWEVVDCDVLSGRGIDEPNSTPLHPLAKSSPDGPSLADAQPFPSAKKKMGRLSSSSKKRGGTPDYVTVPDTVFSLTDKPVCTFEGHLDDVLDLSWSKSQQLLSSSMDKTVRLWDMESKTCLKLFAHNDYVTCIQFNPMDDEYFISGSLDAKVRIWSIPERKVVDWTDLHEMVTAVCYTPDGQGALVGSHKGSCRLYDTSECKLNQKSQVDVCNKKKSQAKKITGFQFAPGNSSEVLITSADSRVRILEGSDITYKFRGFRNTNSQISASFTIDGKYVVSASEDSQVYIWKRDEVHHNTSSGKPRGLTTTQSYERFQSRDVSVAIPWPGSFNYDPSILSQQQSKRYSVPPSPGPGGQEPFLRSPSVTRNLPPLPRKNSITEQAPPPAPSPPAPVSSDDETARNLPKAPTTSDEESTINLPPLPKKNSNSEKAVASPDDEPSSLSRTNSVYGDADSSVGSSSASTSFNYRDSRSVSATESTLASLSWLFDSGSSSSRNNLQSTSAWGLVFVTAGLGGELRIYQNFGLPVRVSRQPSIFRDYSYGSIGSSANKRFP